MGSDKDVIKVAITEQRPQAGLECAIGREYLQCFGTTEGQRRIGSIERVKTGSGNDDDGRLPQPEQESRAGRSRAVFAGAATSPASGAPIRRRRRCQRAGRGTSVGLSHSLGRGRAGKMAEDVGVRSTIKARRAVSKRSSRLPPPSQKP
ncbi:hypothetical protein [Novosphingobium panipatense]|uniref:hypothetical protein n=1 Tax=Novosphingobium panipatense TaxID=428991 RepID=UPI00360C5E6E